MIDEQCKIPQEPIAPEDIALILDQTVELEFVNKSCRRCGDLRAVVGAGRGPHAASLRCNSCEMHRAWVSHESARKLIALRKHFGRFGESTITIRPTSARDAAEQT